MRFSCIFHSKMPGYFQCLWVYEILAIPTCSQVPDEPVLSNSLTRDIAARIHTICKVMKAQTKRVSRDTVALLRLCYIVLFCFDFLERGGVIIRIIINLLTI